WDYYRTGDKSIEVSSIEREIGGVEHFNVYSKERTWGQAFKNVAFAPVQAVRAEGHNVLGTLAQSWAQKAMIDKAERSGRNKWALYASVVAEAAGYSTTALAEFGGNSSGFTYRAPLNKLAYNAQIKSQLNDMARVEKNKKSDQGTDKVLAMKDSEYKAYKKSDAFVKDLEDMGKYDGVANMSLGDAMEALGKTKAGFHGKRALVSVGRDFLSKTAPGAITACLDDTMARKAPEYWGGEGSTTADDFGTQEKYNNWQSKQALNRAYTLNMAGAAIHGVGLELATVFDEDMEIAHFAVRDDQIEISKGNLVSAKALENAGATRTQDGKSLTVSKEAMLKFIKKDELSKEEYEKRYAEAVDSIGTGKTFEIRNNVISMANKVFDVEKVWEITNGKGVTRENDVILISHEALERDFAGQWKVMDKPASFGENIINAMAGSQITPIIRGFTFGYSGFYKEGGKIKQRDYTSAQWVNYLTNLQGVSGAFSSVSAMRNYWANMYMGGVSNNIAGTACTIEPVAKLFGFMPERGIVRPADAKYPENEGYRIYFKNTADPLKSAFVKPYFYSGPYPAQTIIDPTIEQQRMQTYTEPVSADNPGPF
ncbi:MAG: hypothetical protein KKA80_03455, partial [Candidatus Omnitrophica bacterium]|nr:hypothetical protein [Candidatus Omnitrophota bacterium]